MLINVSSFSLSCSLFMFLADVALCVSLFCHTGGENKQLSENLLESPREARGEKEKETENKEMVEWNFLTIVYNLISDTREDEREKKLPNWNLMLLAGFFFGKGDYLERPRTVKWEECKHTIMRKSWSHHFIELSMPPDTFFLPPSVKRIVGRSWLWNSISLMTRHN